MPSVDFSDRMQETQIGRLRRIRPSYYPGNQDPHKFLQPIRSSNSQLRLPRDRRSTTESTEILPRQESFAPLHILTRRASEGSETCIHNRPLIPNHNYLHIVVTDKLTVVGRQTEIVRPRICKDRIRICL